MTIANFYDVVPEGETQNWKVVKDPKVRSISLVQKLHKWGGYELTFMSNGTWEAGFHNELFDVAKGDVLLAGLGLGYDAWVLCQKDSVRSVVTVEVSNEVIALVAKHVEHTKHTVVLNRISQFLKETDRKFDVVWFDIFHQDASVHQGAVDTLTRLAERVLKTNGKILFWRCYPELEI